MAKSVKEALITSIAKENKIDAKEASGVIMEMVKNGHLKQEIW
jgi:sulfite reductase alpha subunit-like flavoprotein